MTKKNNGDRRHQQMVIEDETETDAVTLRRTVYLTIMESLSFEECGHTLLKMKLQAGQEMVICSMIVECCSQAKLFDPFYGLLGQRFCGINTVYRDYFEECFVQQYSIVHRLETNRIRNVAMLFAHLLAADVLPWRLFSYILLTEDDTTSSSRIFLKFLFQDLSDRLGISALNKRLTAFHSIFPKDNPRNTRFSINFFTSIGLAGITQDLRCYLKNMQQHSDSVDRATSSESDTGSCESDGSNLSRSSFGKCSRNHGPKRRKLSLGCMNEIV
ncbi:pre-mRNA-splicing factor cwc22-like [Mercurialis annua]|uniref:pre-mRNA-splicing factor cwc22-like n=1 Tax=Mercurialis annua TaxID=3986 RepID=UPI00215EE572|nr:pre-mRNA-splicing factor cwc22-like [Mercurialis annua]